MSDKNNYYKIYLELKQKGGGDLGKFNTLY